METDSKEGRIFQICQRAYTITKGFAMDPKSHIALRQSSSDSSDLPELLTAKELERLLKIDVKTIYSYVQRGLIPYVRIQSNVRFPKQQIFDWIEAQNYQPRPRIANGACRR